MHSSLYLFIFLCFYIYLSLFIYLYLYISLFVYVSISVHPSVYLFTRLSIYLCLYIYLYIYLSVCLSIYLSIYLPVYLSISIYLFTGTDIAGDLGHLYSFLHQIKSLKVVPPPQPSSVTRMAFEITPFKSLEILKV